VENLDLSIEAGETLALVGESGSGKSVASMAMLGLLPRGVRITGRVAFEGEDLLGLTPRALRQVRGRGIAMIFQEPMTSLNPVLSIGRQLIEALPREERTSRSAARTRAVELLASVGITAPERRLIEFPHQISGGMRQRVMIAIALAGRPRLIIADEPTTALDVTVQAQIAGLLRTLQERTGTALLVISHDLALVRQMASRVAVMYAGRKVEEAPTDQLFARPAHPYSAGLIAAIPRLGRGRDTRLIEIPGTAPSLAERHPGCAFASRCPHVADICWTPPPSQGNACHLAGVLT
jgi:peptide/nickel transport system ATP-binding protein